MMTPKKPKHAKAPEKKPKVKVGGSPARHPASPEAEPAPPFERTPEQEGVDFGDGEARADFLEPVERPSYDPAHES